jgi:hypothetical protein
MPTLVPRSRIFIPWRWRRYVPPKHLFIQDLHDATSQKTTFFFNHGIDSAHYETRCKLKWIILYQTGCVLVTLYICIGRYWIHISARISLSWLKHFAAFFLFLQASSGVTPSFIGHDRLLRIQNLNLPQSPNKLDLRFSLRCQWSIRSSGF